MVLRIAKVMFLARNKLYIANKTRDQNPWVNCVSKNVLGGVIYASLSGSASSGACNKSPNWEHLRKESR